MTVPRDFGKVAGVDNATRFQLFSSFAIKIRIDFASI